MNNATPIIGNKTTKHTFLCEYYTKDGDIHFAWILHATDRNDARRQVKTLRNFEEVILLDEAALHPLVCDPKIIHMVR